MKISVDTFESATGWVATGGATIASDAWPNAIADNLSAYLKMTLPVGGSVKKTYSGAGVSLIGTIGVERQTTFIGFNQMANVFPKSSKGNTAGEYKKTSDFTIKVICEYDNATLKYYVPVSKMRERVHFRTEGAQFLKSIEFVCINSATSILVSGLIAFSPDYPKDIYDAFKLALDPYMKSVKVSTLTAAAGATSVKLNAQSMVERYSCIRFNGETHKVDAFNQDGTCTFFPTLSGNKVVANCTNADVELLIPVVLSPNQNQMFAPGVSIRGGFTPTNWMSELSYDAWDTWIDDGTADGIRYHGAKGRLLERKILIDGFSIYPKSLELIADGISQGMKNSIWVNGSRVEIIGDGDPVFSDLTDQEGFLQVSHQYIVRIEEEIWQGLQKNKDNLAVTVQVGLL